MPTLQVYLSDKLYSEIVSMTSDQVPPIVWIRTAVALSNEQGKLGQRIRERIRATIKAELDAARNR